MLRDERKRHMRTAHASHACYNIAAIACASCERDNCLLLQQSAKSRIAAEGSGRDGLPDNLCLASPAHFIHDMLGLDITSPCDQ